MSVVAQALASLVLLYVGGELLIRGASALAFRLGVSKMAIGLTVVAFGTSTPELVVSLDAALSGANDISLGNVVGSNIANIALILGLAAVITPLSVHAKLVRIHVPLMFLASVGLLLVMADGQAARPEGGLLLLGLIAYTAFTFWEPQHEPESVKSEFEDAAPSQRYGLFQSVTAVTIGLGLLIGGGHLLVLSAVAMAISLGMPQVVVGLTIVAVGTSLPEAAATVLAALRGHGDIAIGNVVGSNLFNILGILGITSVVRPLELGPGLWFDLAVMVGVASALWGVLALRGRLGRTEATLLLMSFAAYVVSLVVARG